MLDLYRLGLALCVVQAHLFVRGCPWLAWQAVFTFYVISGFLITLILNEGYEASPEGLFRFGVNRALRIFPVYWTLLILTLACIAALGPLSNINGAIRPPVSAGEWFVNVFLFGMTTFDPEGISPSRLMPTAWSLSLELFSYVLLALFFSRSVLRLAIPLTAGLAIAGVQIAGSLDTPDYGFQGHYTVLQAGFAPFAVGGLAYFCKDHRWLAFSPWRIWLLLGAAAGNAGLGYVSEFHRYVGGFAIVMALNFFLAPMLFRAAKRGGWRTVAGGMAYPLFLCHWLVGSLVLLFWPELQARGLAHFLTSTVASLALSYVLYVLIDARVQRIRSWVKGPKDLEPSGARPRRAAL